MFDRELAQSFRWDVCQRTFEQQPCSGHGAAQSQMDAVRWHEVSGDGAGKHGGMQVGWYD